MFFSDLNTIASSNVECIDSDNDYIFQSYFEANTNKHGHSRLGVSNHSGLQLYERKTIMFNIRTIFFGSGSFKKISFNFHHQSNQFNH